MIAVLLVSSAVAGENRIRPYRDVLHAALKPVPGFALDDCNLLHGDQLDRIVSWKANTDVSQLAGQTVRLKFELKGADLYSFHFTAKE
jgi:hypothetical protein